MSATDNDEPGPPRIGLTGGIASGKSTVAALFADMGAEVIDADQVARELVEPGQAALAEIIATFGNGIVDSDGRLQRQKLRKIIFEAPERRARLNAILHPLIFAELAARARKAQGPYVILVIPLLAETGAQGLPDRVLVVDCEESEQLRRLMARDAIEAPAARQILAAQASREARLGIANDVLVNQVPLPELRGLVLKLHRMYSTLDSAGDARSRPGLRLP